MNDTDPDQATTIHILPPETAKRIAAGEVIERPQSVLRELVDNSLDAGASDIRVELRGGGLDSLAVHDNGGGMGRLDLALSILPHATSKINHHDDLLALHTLGFRGEALASVAAVADLTIRSAVKADEAWELTAGPGQETILKPSRGSVGTSVTVRSLFASFPARRQFMKRPAAESLACRQVFIDKSLPFPEVSFRFSLDGSASLSLLPARLPERVRQAVLPDQPPEFFRELVTRGPGFAARLVAGATALQRSDRRYLQVFVNRRRVQEFSLQQALEYAYRSVLPGGSFPVVFAFIEVDPAMADFNIHPAKKEVRLRNGADIRQGLIGCLRDYLSNAYRLSYAQSGDPLQTASLFSVQEPTPLETTAPTGTSNFADRLAPWSAELADRQFADRPTDAAGGRWVEALRQSRQAAANPLHDKLTHSFPAAVPWPSEDNSAALKYLGQTLGTFLVFEYSGELLIIDQHAAHERIIFDQLESRRVVCQDLMVPYVYEAASDEEDRQLEGLQPALALQGFRLTKEGGSWILHSLPAILPVEHGGVLFEVVRQGQDTAAIMHQLRANIACKAAIKDGTSLPDDAALSLGRQALALPEARCPHGRPIWLRISRQQLFEAVGRLV